MERLLLLWDELDELMGYGRHLAVGFTHALADSSRRWRGLPARRSPGGVAADLATPDATP